MWTTQRKMNACTARTHAELTLLESFWILLFNKEFQDLWKLYYFTHLFLNLLACFDYFVRIFTGKKGTANIYFTEYNLKHTPISLVKSTLIKFCSSVHLKCILCVCVCVCVFYVCEIINNVLITVWFSGFPYHVNLCGYYLDINSKCIISAFYYWMQKAKCPLQKLNVMTLLYAYSCNQKCNGSYCCT